ncbi:MAG TPA: hypothetical protein VGS07_24135 [Thermoanaerobaculia bacterium]|nr:hypothetical protein [Thermoanaerobaculia bacterium]
MDGPFGSIIGGEEGSFQRGTRATISYLDPEHPEFLCFMVLFVFAQGRPMLLLLLTKDLIRHRSFLFAPTVLLLLIGSAAEAETRESEGVLKPAWEWTVDERLAQRFSPRAMEARAAEHAAEERTFLTRFPEAAADLFESKDTDSSRQATASIEGKKTPELFLPFELFEHLLSMGLSPEADPESRKIIEQRAVALGFGHDLWKRLEKAASPYLEIQREDERRARAQVFRSHPTDSFEMDSNATRYCRARARALVAAKSEFGAEPFLRLLYLGITPGLSITYVVKDGLAEHLRFVEGGCQ